MSLRKTREVEPRRAERARQAAGGLEGCDKVVKGAFEGILSEQKGKIWRSIGLGGRSHGGICRWTFSLMPPCQAPRDFFPWISDSIVLFRLCSCSMRVPPFPASKARHIRILSSSLSTTVIPIRNIHCNTLHTFWHSLPGVHLHHCIFSIAFQRLQ